MAEDSPPAVTGDTTPVISDSATDQPTGAPAAPTVPQRTNAGRLWISIGVATILLILLIIFIAENSTHVKISFLGASGSISAGLAMLIAAVAGALVTLLVGTARIFQLRREVRRRHRRRR